MAKKWPEMVVKQSFMRNIPFKAVFCACAAVLEPANSDKSYSSEKKMIDSRSKLNTHECLLFFLLVRFSVEQVYTHNLMTHENPSHAFKQIRCAF